MITRPLKDLARLLQQSCAWTQSSVQPLLQDFTAHQDVVIAGVSTDSRAIKAGQLFIPLVGERFNGHEFVEQAFIDGAAAALWQVDQPNPPQNKPLLLVEDTLLALQLLAANYRQTLPLKVVAVTGSNGKTTTKDIIAHLLSVKYSVHKTQGNFNNHIGLPLTILQCDEQTEILVAEMGMSGTGEIALLSNIAQPNAVAITMIGEAHIEQLGSREAIADAKLEIVEGLQKEGTLFYHGDEPLLNERVKNFKRTIPCIRFGMNQDNNYVANQIEIFADGATFTVNHSSVRYDLPLLGMHNVQNALLAIAIAEQFGIEHAQIQKALAQIKITAMRGEKIMTTRGVTIINDAYNASPSSMRAALQFVNEVDGYRKKILVLADMLELGEQSQAYHEQIGEELKKGQFDYIFTFGEMAHYIADRARHHYASEAVHSDLDKEQIAVAIEKLANQGDLILLKGSRGMKLEDVSYKLQQLLS